jgi:chromosome segregation ATPase
MKKIIIISSGLSIMALFVVTNTAEAQRPRPILNGPDLNQVSEVRTGVIQRAQNVRQELQEGYQERRIDLQENRSERRTQVQENREERRENIQNRIEERKADLQSRREEMLANREVRRARLTEARKERVQGLFENMFNGFANAAGRLDEIHERISAKIDELEESGVDVGEANSLLETAKGLLDDTIAEIEAVQTEIDEAVEGEITKEYIRELIAGAKESIRATHEAYRAVIAEINQ